MTVQNNRFSNPSGRDFDVNSAQFFVLNNDVQTEKQQKQQVAKSAQEEKLNILKEQFVNSLSGGNTLTNPLSKKVYPKATNKLSDKVSTNPFAQETKQLFSDSLIGVEGPSAAIDNWARMDFFSDLNTQASLS